MRIKSKIEALEKHVGIGKTQTVLMIGRAGDWDDIAPDERLRLPEDELDWIITQEAVQCGAELVLTGCSPRAEIDRRKELGIW